MLAPKNVYCEKPLDDTDLGEENGAYGELNTQRVLAPKKLPGLAQVHRLVASQRHLLQKQIKQGTDFTNWRVYGILTALQACPDFSPCPPWFYSYASARASRVMEAIVTGGKRRMVEMCVSQISRWLWDWPWKNKNSGDHNAEGKGKVHVGDGYEI